MWTLGRHTVSFGTSYSYTQLNTIDKRTGKGTIATSDLSAMVQGFVTTGSAATGFYVTSFLQGNASRYYRANQLGSYVQDKFQVTPTLSLTAGVRYDWDGGLTEKYGRIFNFDSARLLSTLLYTRRERDAGQHSTTNGTVIAGNNANGTAGVSNTTLTGRQWGIASARGRGVAAGDVPQQGGGAGGLRHVLRPRRAVQLLLARLCDWHCDGRAVRRQPVASVRERLDLPIGSLYDGFIPTCGGGGGFGARPTGLHPGGRAQGNLGNPYGTVAQFSAPKNPKSSDLSNYLPNLAADRPTARGSRFAGHLRPRATSFPTPINYTLDIQWQPRNDLAIELGYVGNLGRHQVIPVPFNQPGIATPTTPIHGREILRTATPSYASGYNYDGADFERLRRRQRRPSRSVHRLRGGVDRLQGCRRGCLQRADRACGQADEPWRAGGRVLYVLACAGRAERPGPVLQRQQSAEPARWICVGGLRPHPCAELQLRLPLPEPGDSKHTLEGYFANGWSLVGLTVLQSGQPY